MTEPAQSGHFERCRGDAACPAPEHIHGCFAERPGHFRRAVRHSLRWWQGRAGVGPYRSDTVRWWLRGGPLWDRYR